jgi:hypothetical protein
VAVNDPFIEPHYAVSCLRLSQHARTIVNSFVTGLHAEVRLHPRPVQG